MIDHIRQKWENLCKNIQKINEGGVTDEEK